MSDQDQNQNTDQADITGEFERLGKNIQQVLQSAVESDEFKKIRSEVQQGISDLGETLGHFVHEFSESPTGQKVKTGLDDLQAQARKAELEGRVREEVLNALRNANAGLEKAAAKMKETPASGEAAGAGEGQSGAAQNTEVIDPPTAE